MEQDEEANALVKSDLPEVVIKGIAAAPGIAIGPAFVLARDRHKVEKRELRADEVEAELSRVKGAIERAEADLTKIVSLAAEKLGPESSAILEAQAMMLHDDELYGAVVEDIRTYGVNAEFAVVKTLTRFRRRLDASDDEYIRERANDLLDLQDRLIRHLHHGIIVSNVQPDSIVVAESLTAADIVLFSRRGILGCATAFGGATSHVSIMARALEVPAAVSVHELVDQVRNGDIVIIDGNRGEVLVRPTEATITEYRNRRKRYRSQQIEQQQVVGLPSESVDGQRVTLRANLEFKEEMTAMKLSGAEGVGLLRTEIMALMRGRMTVSEEEHYQMYRRIVAGVAPDPTVIRILDLGGDKMLPLGHREYNPFLGWRGIRVLLDKLDLLVPQLRAVLRASVHGPTKLLLPMVSTVKEVTRFRAILEDVKQDLRTQGIEFAASVPVGIMVEVPSVALMASVFAREVDFLSIGTNDLTQYTLAVDRGNDLVAERYQELHPAVLRLVKMAIDGGRDEGIPVAMCGELAGNPRAAALLFGLGLREYSASPVYLPAVKRIIRSITAAEAVHLASQALACGTAEEVGRLLDAWHESHPAGLHRLLPNGGIGAPA